MTTRQMSLGRPFSTRPGSSRLDSGRHAANRIRVVPGRAPREAINLGTVVPGRGVRSVGWVVLIGLCFALLTVLAFRVNALKSEVRLAENRIVSLKREKLYLETEFETRASQQQLKAWNDVEFGYVAPGSTQYLENERQLASLGKVPGPDAPRPIRVASADDSVVAAAAFPQMVSPLTGALLGKEAKKDEEKAPGKPVDRASATASLGERLGKVERVSSTTPDAPEKTSSAKKAVAKDKKLADARKADGAKAPSKAKVASKSADKTERSATKPATKAVATKVAASTKPKAKPVAQGGSGGPKKEARR